MSAFKLCGFDVGLDHRLFLIAGPCVIESEQSAIDIAGQLKEITSALKIPFIYKSSFDKANRSSGTSFRGLGMDKGLEILAKVKKQVNVPVLTDVHDISEIAAVASVVDVLQTPAFLCRQTDFIRACAQSGKPVNFKKGQFLSPHEMLNVIEKARVAAAEKNLPDQFMVCERGASFTMITVPLKYVFWIGPVGAAMFFLTALVDIVRFSQLKPDEVAHYGASASH